MTMASTKRGENWELACGRITFYGQSGWSHNDGVFFSWIYDEDLCEIIEHPLSSIGFANLVESISNRDSATKTNVSPRDAVTLFLLGIITEADLDRIEEGDDENIGSYIDIPGVNIGSRKITLRITGDY